MNMVLCPTCGGRGYDDLGDVTDSVRDDPDFAEDYFSGVYDTICPECRGRNVVPGCQESGCEAAAEDVELWLEAIDYGIFSRATKCYEHLAPMYQEQVRDHYDYLSEVAAERRAGC